MRLPPPTLLLVPVHGSRTDALAIKAEIGRVLAEQSKMTLSDEKTLVTHLDVGLDFLGFHIRQERRGDGRHVVLTYPSKQALAAVMRKIKRTTGRQARRRYYGADRISESGLTLYNPAKITVERYRYRGARIGTPYNLDVVDPAGARIRHTNHDDVAFVGQVSELHHLMR